eukprot:TRINITY_DN809_c0_g1_i2.p2 TRINITY_DN809_c0_g1~~TRINITY_DN809_c0_g1_i2.p2  ORF type:complete len:127 (+),score=33.57 TRINITY_DN809_c0_g1_i2:320-700(+)
MRFTCYLDYGHSMVYSVYNVTAPETGATTLACDAALYPMRPVTPWFLADAKCTGETVAIRGVDCDHWLIDDDDEEYNFYVRQGSNVLMRVYDEGAFETATLDALDQVETVFGDASFFAPPSCCFNK